MGRYLKNIFKSRILFFLLVAFSLTLLKPLSGMTADMQVSAGNGHTVGLKTDGTVVAVGRDYDNETSVSDWTGITNVAAGGLHTVGVKTDGTVVAVGANDYGQIEVSEWTGIDKVSAGVYHTVGLKTDDTVVAIGPDWHEQTSVSDWTDIVCISAGSWHTTGVKSDGTVLAVGNYEYGQTSVSEWTGIVQVAAGGWHTIGLKADGTVVAVGNNNHGQLDVSGWTDIVQVAAGEYHTIGLKSDGTVMGAGFNECGEINVSHWYGMTQVAAGEYHTVGLRANGVVKAVGYDGYLQTDVSSWRLGAQQVSGPPVKPQLIYPDDGESGVSLTTSLAISDFSDPDTGDTHLETEWQISTFDDFSTLVLSKVSVVNLTSFSVPWLTLKKDTTYYWRARVFDNHSNPSEWMDTASFSTGENLDDLDENGIPDSLENETADLDQDGTPDMDQQDIRSLNTAVGNGQMGVSIRDSATAYSIEEINSIDPQTVSRAARPHSMPLGLFSFRLATNNPGETAETVIHFSEPAPENSSWLFYNPVSGWMDYSEHATFSQDRQSVTVELRDGDIGDMDGIANGVIVDPSGFGIASWIKGKVTDSDTGEPVTTATIRVEGMDVAADSVMAGNFLTMILPGIYNLTASAPGYDSAAVNGIEVSESNIVTQDIQLEASDDETSLDDETCGIKVTGISMSHTPAKDIPVTITASVQNNCDSQLYYRFSIHPDYGTPGYDNTNWMSMTQTEWVSTASIDYTFTESGKYIIVVWAVTDPTSLDSLTDYIMGYSVSIDDDPCTVTLNGSSITGTQRTYRPLTMTVDAASSCDSQLYYRFSIHPDYGTVFYDNSNWSSLTETEWISNSSIEHTFTQAGKYIVVTWISDSPGGCDPSGVPIIGWCMDIDE